MQKGKVKWFNKKKGIGFIFSDNNSNDIFIHYSNIIGDGYKVLEEDDEIIFELENSEKGLIAKNITKI
jgi:CspA family cold shock protein